jgi:hypothetical protein
LSFEGVVLALAERVTDGVNGREIKDIEAHSCDVGQMLGTVAQRAVGSRRAGEGAGNNSYHVLKRALARSTLTRSSLS